ncbi:MAG TPA: hypothetical protein VLC53_00150 [Myxococcota bacterium]|nr:hypothetical protein [Myxococcota bacterium]
MLRLPFVVGVALSLAPVSAHAQMYGCGGNGSDAPGVLFLVDQVTGEQTEIDDVVSPGGLTGLAFDASGNLYGSTIGGMGSTSTLVRIDPQTGALLQTVGAITAPGEGPISIGDLATQPGTGLLFGIRSFADEQGAGGEVYTIDPATAVATFRGDTPGSDGGSLAFAPEGSLFQGARTATSNLVERVDPTTLAVLESKAFATFFDGLAIRPGDGAIFGTGSEGVHRIDFTAGTQATLFPGPMDGSMSDLAFVPEPEGAAAGACALAALARFRSRRRCANG